MNLPVITTATVRSTGDFSWDIEVRLSDGQKYALVSVNDDASDIAQKIADMIVGMEVK
jgi:hypothetical protein